MGSFYSRYHLTCPVSALPRSVRFRNGAVTFEIARETAHGLPTWTFRARKLGISPVQSIRQSLALVPSASPIDVAREASLAAAHATFTITSCFHGRRHLEAMLREGITLPDDSTHARLMDALVALGRAKRWNAGRRDRA